VLIVVGGFLIALGIPFLNVNVGSPWADILPPKAEARQGWTTIADEIGPGELAPILVVAVPSDGTVDLNDAPALLRLLSEIEKDPVVQRAEISTTAITGGDPISLDGLSRAMTSGNLPDSLPIAVVSVYSRFGPADAETKALVKRLRAVPEPDGIHLLVGGGTADLNDAVDQMYGTFPWVIVYTMVAVYLALMILFRSIALPLKAVVMNSMSLFAAYGALVLIFQNGVLDWLLGTEATGFTEMTVPILIFAVAFGLSVDYEVFLLSRVKEYWDKTGDNRYAVQMGMEKTGRIVTSAALILVLVAGSFATADIVVVKALGIGTAIAIGLDASIVRALFVPAIMRLMGRANWWAPRLLR
jgi:RND superfamily putative drug exporter